MYFLSKRNWQRSFSKEKLIPTLFKINTFQGLSSKKNLGPRASLQLFQEKTKNGQNHPKTLNLKAGFYAHASYYLGAVSISKMVLGLNLILSSFYGLLIYHNQKPPEHYAIAHGEVLLCFVVVVCLLLECWFTSHQVKLWLIRTHHFKLCSLWLSISQSFCNFSSCWKNRK